MACDSCESLKTRVAADVTANQAYQLGRTTKLPEGFSAVDLATLTVWFLISTGHRAVAAQFKEQMEGIELGMTMGVPTEFLNHQELKAASLLLPVERGGSIGMRDFLMPRSLSSGRAECWKDAQR